MSDIQNTSPFAALTYAEQQDRWREWRSRQLDYKNAEELPPVELPLSEQAKPPAPRAAAPAEPPSSRAEELPLAPRPVLSPAPTRHKQLDSLTARHKDAAKRAANWQPV